MDEVLGAGDARFRVKAEARMNKLISKANALVLSPHAVANIAMYCNRVIVMKSGRVAFDGDPGDATKFYQELVAAASG